MLHSTPAPHGQVIAHYRIVFAVIVKGIGTCYTYIE